MAIGPYFCLSRNAGAAHLVALGQVVVRHAGAPWTVHSASVLHLLAKPLDLAREGSLLLAKLHALLMHPVAQSAERLALAPQRRRGRWSRPKPPGAIHDDGLRRAADRLAVDALQEGGGLLAGGTDPDRPRLPGDAGVGEVDVVRARGQAGAGAGAEGYVRAPRGI